VLTIAEMLEHPQVRARDMLVETQHPVAGATLAIGCPIKLSATPASVRRPAPVLGQHTREVLLEFGLAAADVQALLDAGAGVQARTGAA
jgi:crotonobetainyl-CoA:carnitine CoA-transferase CaiB-like acyl-CoA transferase